MSDLPGGTSLLFPGSMRDFLLAAAAAAVPVVPVLPPRGVVSVRAFEVDPWEDRLEKLLAVETRVSCNT